MIDKLRMRGALTRGPLNIPTNPVPLPSVDILAQESKRGGPGLVPPPSPCLPPFCDDGVLRRPARPLHRQGCPQGAPVAALQGPRRELRRKELRRLRPGTGRHSQGGGRRAARGRQRPPGREALPEQYARPRHAADPGGGRR